MDSAGNADMMGFTNYTDFPRVGDAIDNASAVRSLKLSSPSGQAIISFVTRAS